MSPGRPAASTPERWSWVDLRLVPAAVTVWAGSLLAPVSSPPVTWAVAAGAVAAGVLVSRRRGPGAVVALGVLAALAVTAATAAVRAGSREASPLTAVAGAGRAVTVELALDGDPRPVRGPGPGRVVADATVTAVEHAGGRTRTGDGVVLFAPAEGWLGLLPGQRLRVRAWVTPADPADAVVARVSARDPPALLGPPPTAQRVAGGLRDGLAGSAARVLDDRAGGLLPGLVVGDTRAMDPVLREDFRRAGLAHLTAVSGANVAIVLAGLLAPLRRRAVDRRVQALVAVAGLVGFVLLARPTASVVRAAAMGAVSLLALATGRSRAAVPALAGSVVVLLLADPALARDAGFALSVVATGAIVLLAPGWSRRLHRRGVPRPVADALSVAAAAGLATAPLVAGLSGLVSPVSLPANLLAAPAVPPATVLGLGAAVAGAVWTPAGDALTWLAGWPVRWLVLVAEQAAAVPDGAAAWPAGTRGAVLLTVLLLAAGVLLWRFPRTRALAVAVLLGVVVLGWPLRQVTGGWPPAETVLVACDVGQGDALVVPTGPGEGILVDTGAEVAAVDGCLHRLGIDRLPLVLLTHLDADHVGGLAGALSGRQVGEVATGTLSPAEDRAAQLTAVLRRAGVGARAELVPGQRRTVGTALVEVLAPPPGIATATATANDLSLVVRVTQHGVRVLLTGDLSAQAEARLHARGVDLRADVLKVPHHGSADADRAFLAATGARAALVSVGAGNTYGHPAPRLLTWLAQLGMVVHRTDLQGDLAVAGTADRWGVAARGGPAAVGSADPGGADPAAADAARPTPGDRRRRVAPCRGGRRTSRPDLPAPRGRGGGGAAARPGCLRRPRRRARPPPRRRAARAARPGAAGRAAGRRAGALAVRRAPPRGRHRRARGRDRARRRADLLPRRSRPGADPRRRAPRRQAQRGPGQGIRRRGCRRRRVPQGQLGRGPHRVRAQRRADGRRPDHPRCRGRARRGGRRRPAPALLGGRPAGLRLRGHRRRRRRGPLPPRSGRGQRLHRGREGARRRPPGVAGGAALGVAAGGGARADRRRHRRRGAHRRAGHLAAHHERGRSRAHPQDAALEGAQGPAAGAGVEHRGPAAGHRRGRRAQRRRQGRRRQRRLRAGERRPAHRRHPGGHPLRPRLTRRRRRDPAAPGPRNANGAPSREGRGSVRPAAPGGAAARLRDRRCGAPCPTCGWRPGSCG
ncbi:ComEC/Rec2 family competence protein [Geodermatophilus marinus]|nr:ComEC/Rec2 family competence protein [Geodermatophilus sp. LHW52908]